MTKTPTYAVIWCSAGCLPDADYPAFVGTLAECEEYVTTDPDGYRESVADITHNLYDLEIVDYYDDDMEES